jgi:hypothetical protein
MRSIVIALLLFGSIFFTRSTPGDIVSSPVFQAAVDDAPRDGVPDSLRLDSPFLTQASSIERRNIVEFDISELSNDRLIEARFEFRLAVNNAGGSATREFNLFAFDGDGIASVDDFNRAGVFIDRVGVTLTNPANIPSFDIDVSDIVNSARTRGVDFSGFLFDPVADNIFATAVSSPRLTLIAIPEPSSAIILAVVTLFCSRRSKYCQLTVTD